MQLAPFRSKARRLNTSRFIVSHPPSPHMLVFRLGTTEGSEDVDGAIGVSAREPRVKPCTLRGLVLYFLRLGALGFGGPIALVGYMQRDLVDERRWFTKEEYDEGLALAQLAPGPLAAQLAIYLGWLRGKLLGAFLVAFAFVMPSFVMVLALSAAYVRYGGLRWMQGAFYGVGAAVIAIIGRSAVGLVRKTLKSDRLLWAIAAINAIATVVTASEIVWLVVAGGAATLFARGLLKPPSTPVAALAPLPAILVTGLGAAADLPVLARLFGYFAMAGALVFGSGLAIVPFLHGGVVVDNHWLDERQFLDAVAVAMITPGPVVITVAFIGYMVAGPLGATVAATVAALGMFLPCFLFVVIPAPYYRRYASGKGRVKTFVDGVTAGAIGAIAGAAIVLARRALIDPITVVIALVTLATLVKTKIPEPVIIVAAAIVGIAIRTFAS
jgi:chromate transporter